MWNRQMWVEPNLFFQRPRIDFLMEAVLLAILREFPVSQRTRKLVVGMFLCRYEGLGRAGYVDRIYIDCRKEVADLQSNSSVLSWTIIEFGRGYPMAAYT
jgi:hypothetical protein